MAAAAAAMVTARKVSLCRSQLSINHTAAANGFKHMPISMQLCFDIVDVCHSHDMTANLVLKTVAFEHKTPQLVSSSGFVFRSTKLLLLLWQQPPPQCLPETSVCSNHAWNHPSFSVCIPLTLAVSLRTTITVFAAAAAPAAPVCSRVCCNHQAED